MIQEYLNAQFIQTDDANFEKLKKACTDIGKKISKDKPKILALSLVAFDPDISPDNAEVADVKNQILENWPTFMSNARDTSLTTIRAVMLDVLQTAAKEPTNAALIWYAARNSTPFFKLGREQELLTKFLLDLGNAIEAEAVEAWNFTPDYEMEVPKTVAAGIEEADVAAMTPAAIKEGVGKAFKKQTAELRESQREFGDKIAYMQLRTQLLWWKEAGYSTSKKSTYLGMREGELEVVLARDYSTVMTTIFPVSVDYFLMQTLKDLSANSSKAIKISDFMKSIELNKSQLKRVFSDDAIKAGRISLVDFIKGIIYDKFQGKQLKSLIGVEDTTELTSQQIMVWLFHDFHAVNISLS